MGCLQQILCGERTIIGIRNYKECSNPESNLFINDLPGVSLKLASNIASEELHTGAEVLKKCIDIGTKKVFDDFTLKVSPYFDFNAVVETKQIDRFSQTETIAAASSERGLVLKRWRSELSQIYVEEVYIKVDTDITTSLYIYDGTELAFTYENVVLHAGIIKTILIDKKFNSEKVKIVMDNTYIGVYTNDIVNWYKGDGCSTCSGSNQGLVIKGWDGTQENNFMYGIGVKSSVRCYEENVICSVLPRMYFFIWYASGIEFMKERLYSDRLNPVVVFTRETAQKLLEEYEIEYDKKYAVFSKNIYAFLRSLKGECLTCNGNHYAQIHP